MRRYLKSRDNRITLMLFIITMITAISPLISRYCINGHDIEYHLLRIESLKEGILTGHPFTKVNPLFFGGAGYASSMFYSDLLMHIPALLRVMHVSIGKSFHIYTALIFVLCYLSAFYCVWKMTGSKFAGTVAAILLTLCPYHMDDMLVRTACGENTAFIFLPFAIYGVYNVLYEDMNRPMMLGLGFSGLIITHPSTFVITFCFAAAVFLIGIRKFIKEPKIFVKLCIVTLLAALVTSYQWVPMLEQFASAKFYVSDNWTDLLDSSVNFADVVSSTFPCMGFLLFGLAIPRFFISRRDFPILKFVDLMIIFAAVFAAGATNIMPWERVAQYFGFLQFPWRMFIISSVLLAMADAVILKLFIDRFEGSLKAPAADVTLIIVLVVSSMRAVDHQNAKSMGYYDYSDDYYDYKPYTAGVIAGEWLPAAVDEPGSLVEQSMHMIYDDGSEAKFTRKGTKIISKTDSVHRYVDVPFVYYKGYSAFIVDLEGNRKKLEVTGEGTNGLCRVMLEGAKGELTVYYAGTILQYVSLATSVVFILLIFDLLYLKNKYKKKLRSRAAAAGANLGKIACFVLTVAAAVNLCACSVSVNEMPSAQETYSDPDEVIDYLKYVKNEAEGDGIDALIRINYSQKGYDSKAGGYTLLIDETSGKEVISVIPLEEAQKKITEEIPVKDGLYDELLREEVGSVRDKYRTDSIEDRIMNETNALLCLEVFPEKSSKHGIRQLAEELAEDIMNIPMDRSEDVLDKYSFAAVLAKASYVMDNWERAEEAFLLAEQYFKDAELVAVSDGEPIAARLWAAAELYRLTGQKTYRSVVDAIAMDTIPEGFSYEEPGFFGLFAYLMSPNETNRNVCGKMMEKVFSEANVLIREPVDAQFYGARIDEDTLGRDEESAKRMLYEADLVTMTDYVSVSVEYKTFVRDRLSFIYGANLSGTDLTGEDHILCDAPKLFVLTGLASL